MKQEEEDEESSGSSTDGEVAADGKEAFKSPFDWPVLQEVQARGVKFAGGGILTAEDARNISAEKASLFATPLLFDGFNTKLPPEVGSAFEKFAASPKTIQPSCEKFVRDAYVDFETAVVTKDWAARDEGLLRMSFWGAASFVEALGTEWIAKQSPHDQSELVRLFKIRFVATKSQYEHVGVLS